MKLKGNELLNIYDAFENISTEKMDLNTSFIIAKNIKEISIAKELIDQKRNELIQNYAEKDEQGNVISPSDNGSIKIINVQEFTEKLNELLTSEVDVNIDTVSKKSLSQIKVSPKDILSLMDILSEE